jgi:small-conductance mechanosensitive channel
MNLIHQAWQTLEEFPEFLPAVAAALTILLLALPLYLGIWYFLRRRNLPFPMRLQVGCLSSFILFAGLAFLFASPLANRVSSIVLNAYLFITCAMAAYTVVPLVDVFLIEHVLIHRKGIYISPPLRKVINFIVFFCSFIPILRYLLRFNPFALVAIPTIATAGIALALQDTLKAFIAGVGLGQIVRVGDWIAFQDKEGRVVDINWGRTALRTIQGDLLFIPNTLLLTQAFFNYSTHRSHRMALTIGVAYSASPQRVKQALERCADGVPGLAASQKPVAQILEFSDPSIHYALFYWIEDYGQRYTIQDLLATRVWDALRQEGFEVPFPFQTRAVDAANPSALAGSVRPPSSKPA